MTYLAGCGILTADRGEPQELVILIFSLGLGPTGSHSPSPSLLAPLILPRCRSNCTSSAVHHEWKGCDSSIACNNRQSHGTIFTSSYTPIIGQRELDILLTYASTCSEADGNVRGRETVSNGLPPPKNLPFPSASSSSSSSSFASLSLSSSISLLSAASLILT